MTLREKQSAFAGLVARLILQAEAMGYEVTLGEAWRSPEEAARLAAAGKGSKNSLHCLRLAQDINLFRDGAYLMNSEDHRPLGEWWKRRHPLCRWGGDFLDKKGRPKPDGNHYSLEHGGRA